MPTRGRGRGRDRGGGGGRSRSRSRSRSSSNSISEKARKHIEEIRKHKFSIGKDQPNPLNKDLHLAVTNLSAELYTKDLHFLMELIQNAEDNEYLEGVEPKLEFVLTEKDVSGCGAPATLLVFNNEVGFSEKDMDSICSVGRSTKKGLRHQGFIGEKGIGFKSVFLISAQPHIFSNGYQVRFNELPNEDCGVGYIVPEWIDNKPSIADIKQIYGTEGILPTTIIILPLKPEKVKAVRKQLSEVHPEVLLFLSKIKQLSVQVNNGKSLALDFISSIAISGETNLVSLRSQGVDSRIVHVSVQEGPDLNEATGSYYIWRQVFPVKPECKVSGRKDVKEWAISLAFPVGERLKTGTSSVGIFAFLPTVMVTNFPFIVQADFMLASSRETILLDNQWNLGILDHVPSAFVNAIISCIKSTEDAPWFSVTRVLEFFPTQESPFKEFDRVRQSIRTMVQTECIIPCESFSDGQRNFCQPTEVIRILPEFRKILVHIKEQGFSLNGIFSLRKFVLHTSIDLDEFEEVLDFIGVASVHESYAWYGKCIRACNLMSRVPTNMYIELLCFCVDHWTIFLYRYLNNIPLLKYVAWDGKVVLCSISQIRREALKVHLVLDTKKHAWLNKWNIGMGCPNNIFFLSDAMVTALLGDERQYILKQWLVSKAGVVVTSVSQYCLALAKFVGEKRDPELAVSLANLVYHSKLMYYTGMCDVLEIFQSMPIVDRYGKVHLSWTKILVPASGSKWAKLFGPDNPFAGESGKVKVEVSETEFADMYVELGEVYGEAAESSGKSRREKGLLGFLTKHTAALDLPDLPPMDLPLQVAYSQLTSDQAILLLDWIRFMRTKGHQMPSRFIESIRHGKWMKTYSGFNSPTQSLICNAREESTLMQVGNIVQVLSVVDQEFYANRISSYEDELKLIGVRIGFEHMHHIVIDHLKHYASFTMTREWAVFLLYFVKHARVNYMLDEGLIRAIREGKWLKTNHGYSTPVGSIFLKSAAEAVLQITNLPVIDQTFYCGQIDYFVDELKLLGVVIDIEGVFKLIPDTFKFPDDLSTLTRNSILLMLECIRHLGPAAIGLKQKLRDHYWVKTSFGFRRPSESLLPDQKWDHFLKVIPLPIIDEAFYGSGLKACKKELKAIGVVVDLDGTCKMLSAEVRPLLSSGCLTSTHVISILNCMKCMDKTMNSELLELRSCFLGEKWLKTSHGYKYASDSVLFDSKWQTVSQFVSFPLIDEAFYGTDIYSYKDQLKMLGVVVDFSDGAHFVARGLSMPKEPALVTADCAHSLLQCVNSLQTNLSDRFLLEELLKKLRGSKWLKTHMGYRSPLESLLFNPKWECYLEKTDAPFIDQSFYGDFTPLEKDSLKVMGVKADTKKVCTLISAIMGVHTQTCVIMRIYKFLNRFKWCPRVADGFFPQVWIPDQYSTDGGKWVDSQVCILHDRENMFHSHLHALEKYYENELLPFFKLAFGVAEVPSPEDHMRLWNDWESSKQEVAPAKCGSFWTYIAENWNSVTEEILKKNITMLPTTSISGDGVQLVKKEAVLIPDDLQLKKMFINVTMRPLFVWYPQDDLSSLFPAKMYEIYTSLGVQKISESVLLNPSCIPPVGCGFQMVDLKNELIREALVKIVLGYLGHPRIKMSVEERHKTAKSLLDISVVLTDEPIEASYILRVPSLEEILCVKTRRMVLWDKNSGRFYVQKSSWNHQRNNIEFVIEYSRTVSEGLLPGRTDLVDKLCKIIQMGFVFGFREDAVDFLLVTENLALSVADRDFLNAAFPLTGKVSSTFSLKRHTVLDSPTVQESSIRRRIY